MSSTGKNLLAKGTGSQNLPRYLRVEVTTHQCSDEECYIHDIPLGDSSPNWYSIMDAIDTLYGHEGVTGVSIYEKEE